MSLFMPPISPIKDENTGKTVKSATLTPFRTMSIDEVHRLITSDQRLAELTLAIRNAAAQGDETTARFLKQQTLPYVTPCGVFTRRRSDCLTESSGLVVVDIDQLTATTIRCPLSMPCAGVHQPHRTGRKSVCSLSSRTESCRRNTMGHELRPLHV